MYADDLQLVCTFKPGVDYQSQVKILEECLCEIKLWMSSNFLKLNTNKTEIMLIGSRANLISFSHVSAHVGNDLIQSCDSVKSLGVKLQSNLSMEKFVNDKCRVISHYLRKLSKVKKFLTRDSCKTIVHAMIFSKLDYCNSLLADIPNYLCDRLQRLMNWSARLICNLGKFDHVTPSLINLHWLPVRQRINFRILVLSGDML